MCHGCEIPLNYDPLESVNYALSLRQLQKAERTAGGICLVGLSEFVYWPHWSLVMLYVDRITNTNNITTIWIWYKETHLFLKCVAATPFHFCNCGAIIKESVLCHWLNIFLILCKEGRTVFLKHGPCPERIGRNVKGLWLMLYRVLLFNLSAFRGSFAP